MELKFKSVDAAKSAFRRFGNDENAANVIRQQYSDARSIANGLIERTRATLLLRYSKEIEEEIRATQTRLRAAVIVLEASANGPVAPIAGDIRPVSAEIFLASIVDSFIEGLLRAWSQAMEERRKLLHEISSHMAQIEWRSWEEEVSNTR